MGNNTTQASFLRKRSYLGVLTISFTVANSMVINLISNAYQCFGMFYNYMTSVKIFQYLFLFQHLISFTLKSCVLRLRYSPRT